MNFYEVAVIKKTNKDKNKFNLLFKTDKKKYIRKILGDLGFVVFSVKLFEGDIKDFGKFIFTIKYKNDEYNIVYKGKDIKKTYMTLRNYKLDITGVNRITKPLSEQKADKILEQLKEYREYKIGKSRKKKEQKEKKEQKKVEELKDQGVSRKALEKLKGFCSETIEDANRFIKKAENIVHPRKLKEFEDSLGELKRIRMGNNYEKISNALEMLLYEMERLEIDYIHKMKENEKQDLKNDIISKLDVVKEYDKFKKAQRLINVQGSDKGFFDYFYGILGKIKLGKPAMYFVLIVKNIKLWIKKHDAICRSYDILEYFFIFVLIEFVLFYLLGLLSGQNRIVIFYYLWQIGLGGLILLFIKRFKKENILHLVFMVFVSGIIFLLFRNWLLGFFAF